MTSSARASTDCVIVLLIRAWRVSINLNNDFCKVLKNHDIQISTDDNGCRRDNAFVTIDVRAAAWSSLRGRDFLWKPRKSV